MFQEHMGEHVFPHVPFPFLLFLDGLSPTNLPSYFWSVTADKKKYPPKQNAQNEKSLRKQKGDSRKKEEIMKWLRISSSLRDNLRHHVNHQWMDTLMGMYMGTQLLPLQVVATSNTQVVVGYFSTAWRIFMRS